MLDRRGKYFRLFILSLAVLLITATYLTKTLHESFEGQSISWPQALMFVVETITTTGYGELLPFSSWQMNIFAILLMVIGVTSVFFFLATIATEWLKTRFQELPPTSARAGLKGHVIVSGSRTMIEALIRELAREDVSVLVIEPDREAASELSRRGIGVVWGEPAEGSVLSAANIASARAVVTAASDAVNANVVLQARVMTQAPIVATVENEAHRKNLLHAGATTVINPKVVLGEELARWALSSVPRTLIAATASISGLQLMEVPVYPRSEFAGKTVGEVQFRQRTGATILGVWHNGVFEMVEGPNTRLEENSVMAVVGSPEQLRQFSWAGSTTVGGETPTRNGGRYLVAGYGGVGKRVVEILRERGIPYTLVAPEKIDDEWAVVGDATVEECLVEAGIKKAVTYIVSLSSDSNAVLTTLLARRLNPSLRVLVRVNDAGTVEKLYRAGADAVLSYSEFSGRMVARALWIDDWRDIPDQEIEFMEYQVGEPLGGMTIAEANIFRNTGCVVIGVQHSGGFQPNPPADTRLESGSTIMLLGSEDNLAGFLRRYGAKAVVKSG